MHSKSLLLNCLLLITLTSCSNGWKESFDEKPISGYPHSSISQISELIETDEINKTSYTPQQNIKLFPYGNVYRTNESIQKFYIMTYEDSDHNLHEGHYIYTVINPAQWDIQE